MRIFVIIVLSLLYTPFTSLAQIQPSGLGTEASPYLIQSLDNLKWISENESSWSSYFKQTADINAAATKNWNSGAGFKPIGTLENNFTGTYDGEGYFITELNISRPNEDLVGFIGVAYQAEINKLGFIDVNVHGRDKVGTIIGGGKRNTMFQVFVTGTIDGNNEVGGLVGWNDGSYIKEAWSGVKVTGNNKVGGFIGRGELVQYENVYTESEVIGEEEVGGFAGYLRGYIEYCLAAGPVSGSNYVGAAYGKANDASYLSECFIDKGSVNDTYLGQHGALHLSAEKTYSRSNYSDWDLNDIWYIFDEKSRPFLRFEWSDRIHTLHQLQLISLNLSADYVLARNIEGDVIEGNPAQIWLIEENLSLDFHNFGFIPIGTVSEPFTGSFDGNGFTISGLWMDRSTEDDVGLFGYSNNAEITNLKLSQFDIIGRNNVGGIVGSDNNSNLTNLMASGTLQGNNNVGGLVGLSTSGYFKNNFTNVEVIGTTVLNGLVGATEASLETSIAKRLNENKVLVIGESRSDSTLLENEAIFRKENYQGFNFEDHWDIYDRFSPPFLKNGSKPYASKVSISGTEGWRLMTNPIHKSSIGSMLDTLWTQGFPGADAPNNGVPNVAFWGEHIQSWAYIPDASFYPPAGIGFIAYVYDDQNGDKLPEGFPKDIIQYKEPRFGDISIPISYTDVNLPIQQQGWNLVGNPYGFAINWDTDSGWGKTNIDAPLYVWNAESGEYQSWNGYVGTLENGVISPYQGFWVKANGSAPQLTINEEARSTGGIFYKQNKTVPKIVFSLTSNSDTSTTIIMLSSKSLLGKDVLDSYKLDPLNGNSLSLFTLSEDGTALDINALPESISEPLTLNIDYTGVSDSSRYKLAWESDFPADWQLFITDNQSGEVIDLSQQSELIFDVLGDAQKSTAEGQSIVKNRPISSIKLKRNGNPRFSLQIVPNITVSIESSQNLPSSVGLDQNYPNPFNPSTEIKFQLPQNSAVSLKVFDVLGREVATLIDGQVEAGFHQVTFNARNLSSGMYIYRLQTGNTVITKKLTLIK